MHVQVIYGLNILGSLLEISCLDFLYFIYVLVCWLFHHFVSHLKHFIFCFVFLVVSVVWLYFFFLRVLQGRVLFKFDFQHLVLCFPLTDLFIFFLDVSINPLLHFLLLLKMRLSTQMPKPLKLSLHILQLPLMIILNLINHSPITLLDFHIFLFLHSIIFQQLLNLGRKIIDCIF